MLTCMRRPVSSAAKSAEVLTFPDNRFDSCALLDLVKAVEQKKSQCPAQCDSYPPC